MTETNKEDSSIITLSAYTQESLDRFLALIREVEAERKK